MIWWEQGNQCGVQVLIESFEPCELRRWEDVRQGLVSLDAQHISRVGAVCTNNLRTSSQNAACTKVCTCSSRLDFAPSDSRGLERADNSDFPGGRTLCGSVARRCR